MKFDIYKLSDGSRNRVVINSALRKNLIKNIENLKKQKIKLKESLFLFEENTEKWWRLKEHLYGFGGLKYLNTKESTNKLLSNLDKFYPRKRISSITFSDVVRAVGTLGKSNLKNISNYLARKNTVTYEYLNKLTRWKILSSKREGLNNRWLLNSKFPDIRRYNMYGR